MCFLLTGKVFLTLWNLSFRVLLSELCALLVFTNHTSRTKQIRNHKLLCKVIFGGYFILLQMAKKISFASQIKCPLLKYSSRTVVQKSLD